jgi:hypothetical protein
MLDLLLALDLGLPATVSAMATKGATAMPIKQMIRVATFNQKQQTVTSPDFGA